MKTSRSSSVGGTVANPEGGFTTGALTADTSKTLGDHPVKKRVRISNPATATNTLWVNVAALGGAPVAVVGTGTEIPPGERESFFPTNANQIAVISHGTQAVGYTVE